MVTQWDLYEEEFWSFLTTQKLCQHHHSARATWEETCKALRGYKKTVASDSIRDLDFNLCPFAY